MASRCRENAVAAIDAILILRAFFSRLNAEPRDDGRIVGCEPAGTGQRLSARAGGSTKIAIATERARREYCAQMARKTVQIGPLESHLGTQRKTTARNQGRPSGSLTPNPTMPVRDHTR